MKTVRAEMGMREKKWRQRAARARRKNEQRRQGFLSLLEDHEENVKIRRAAVIQKKDLRYSCVEHSRGLHCWATTPGGDTAA